uniref:Uncharacterized protein n=1 Tax=Lactuca sativa TaxID=4236 RepID=A0A9R1X7E8_LACSA|nr:hypothetical protein LSAT_V11C600315240 [Lactuca sativa]
MAKSLNEHNGGLRCGVLGVRGCKGALGRRLRHLNRLQAPDLGFSSHRPDSPSPLGRLVELVTYLSTRIPLRIAESFLRLAESLLNLGFPLLSWLSKSWVLQYYHKMTNLADTMANIDHPMTDEEVIGYILAGLGPGHGDLFTAIIVLGNQQAVTLSEFYSYLIVHEAQVSAVNNVTTYFVSSTNNAIRQDANGSCRNFSQHQNGYNNNNNYRNNYKNGSGGRRRGRGRDKNNGGGGPRVKCVAFRVMLP